jgi:hypothetical protein
MAAAGAILQAGYIRSLRADLAWFVALPFAAVLIATGFHHFLPYMAQVSVAVWVTIPHHYATWVRSYGMQEDWSRWKDRLVLGPPLLIGSVILGSAFTPVTIALVLMLWDHQHSMMQQHGFARIYDFKAGTGSPLLRRLDLWLGAILYANLLVTAPLWSELWIAELYRWDLQVRAEVILRIQSASWAATGVFLAGYLAYLLAGVARGQRVNPLKYAFLGASYGLWYWVSWQDSFVIYTVAHRIMHGVQYIVFVYWYLGRKAATTGATPRLFPQFGLGRFLLLGAAYAVVFQVAVGSGLADFSFGLVQMLQADEYLRFSAEQATGFYAATAVSAAAAVHYFVDSFIWKVSDSRTQQGL